MIECGELLQQEGRRLFCDKCGFERQLPEPRPRKAQPKPTLTEQNKALREALEAIGRECADIREGIRLGKVEIPIADNSFYVIEEIIADLYRGEK